MCSSKKQSLNFNHPVYQNDPLLFKSYINKHVNVITEDGKVHPGVVYTVDPVSESIVLMEDKGTRFSLTIVFGHAIKRIETSSTDDTILPDLFIPTCKDFPQYVLKKKKDAIKKLLIENRFPVEEMDDVLLIQDVFSIEPPYNLGNCICNNGIILSRIQKIIAEISDLK